MELKQRLVSLVCLLMAAALVFAVAGCNKNPTDNVTSPGTEETLETTPEPTPEARRGGWLDDITFAVVSEDSAVSKVTSGDIDIYAGALSGAANFESIKNSGIGYSTLSNKYYEIMLNPSDTTEKAGELNPFAVREVREAMNWLIDREYICQEIFGGTAMPKYVPESQGMPDYERYIDNIRQVEAVYAYDSEKAVGIIDGSMAALGAQKGSDGVWTYDGSPVVITALIRNDDSMLNQIGDYVCNELVRIGFTVERKYMSLTECFSIWSETDPAENEWDIYTGAWGINGKVLTGGNNYKFYYTPESEYGYTRLYQSYKTDDVFHQACLGLADLGFTSGEERDSLYAQVLSDCNKYSFRVWICDGFSYIPRSTRVITSGDAIRGVLLNRLTPFTIRFSDQEGGSLVWANSALFENPVNPVGGSNSEFDSQYKNFTQDYGIISDPLTGQYFKQRLESANVVMQTGLPVTAAQDWVGLTFQDEIAVPADAMVAWDAAAQVWKTADQEYLNSLVADAAAQLATVDADKDATDEELAAAQARVDEMQAVANRGYLTAKRKSVVTYPSNLYDVTWHDGSSISAADFMMHMIVAFDTGDEGSPYYDPSLAGALDSFKEGFKGWKIISADPLTIEYYSDVYSNDAEADIEALWPDYGCGQSNWADMAVSLQAVAAGGVAFTKQASESSVNADWLDWLSGPSLQALEDSLEKCIEDKYIPYEPTMGQFVTADQAAKAYDNILNFYSEYGHFYIGCGPYFISSLDKSAMTLTLTNYDKYIDQASKWSAYTEPGYADAAIDGPDIVDTGREAVFSVDITGGGGSVYPSGNIDSVEYIVYNAKGETALFGQCSPAGEGQYNITLSSDDVALLGGGGCRLEVIVFPVANTALASAEKEFTVE